MARPLDQILDNEVRIQPGADGSFVVRVGEATNFGQNPAPFFGFTNVTDLLTWLQRAAQARQAAETPELLTDAIVGARPLPAGSWPIPNSTGDTRRTTALGSLADRIAAAEQPKGAA
jgi:hypothetical protein